MKTKLEIIQETQDAYPHTFCRAVDDYYLKSASCFYIDTKDSQTGGEHDNGAMCAVGRCMLNPKKYGGFAVSLHEALKPQGGLDTLLKPEYRGHCVEFWGDLQSFHDDGENFTDGGLSVEGLGYLSELRTKWEGK
jgi:hypothetical protein